LDNNYLRGFSEFGSSLFCVDILIISS